MDASTYPNPIQADRDALAHAAARRGLIEMADAIRAGSTVWFNSDIAVEALADVRNARKGQG